MSLRTIIEQAVTETGTNLSTLTVLSSSRDPYRLDTPTRRAEAEWLLAEIDRLAVQMPIHLRGLHYALVGRATKPDGSAYTNTDETWLWLSEKVAGAARFLGLLDFDDIVDSRNDAPLVFTPAARPLFGAIASGLEIELPDPEDLEPRAVLNGTLGRQAWRLAVIGEKTSLRPVLSDLCREFGVTLVTPAGEVSTTLIYELLRDAELDGRPVAIFQLADFDPAGRQMAVSTGRKVQALVDGQFPNVRARVHAIGLTGEQCAKWGLPSTPLKAGESRADRWLAATGREQTELDAAIGICRDKLVDVVRSGFRAYFDPSVARKAQAARHDWEAAADGLLADQLGEDTIAAIRATSAEKLEQVSGLIDELRKAVEISADDLGVELPPLPEPIVGSAEGDGLECLIDTDHGLEACTASLRARKDY